MNLPPLIRALLNPEVWDHPTDNIQCLETHISWIILTGSFAYKIKKPVDFGFLNFTTLSQRKFFCHEELRLNRRLAPELYLQVVSICGDATHPRLGTQGPVIEYAVKMRQFDQSDLLANQALKQRLQASHIEQLARLIAQFHLQSEAAGPGTPYGEPHVIAKAALDNFDLIDVSLLPKPSFGPRLERLRSWTEDLSCELTPEMQVRKREGYVRDCHGDLHLGNIVVWQDRPVPFDCIEFNPLLRWIDVVSEIAFTIMDLTARGYRPFGTRFLNDYMSHTGGYSGLRLLRYYLVYRAMVRTKITCLNLRQREEDTDLIKELERYLELAENFSHPPPPFLLITHGFSGSGKSHVSRRLADRVDALHLRSDVERKRLAGLPPEARSHSRPGADLYSEEFTKRTYQRLLELAKKSLQSRFRVIVDATFLRRQEREHFQRLADALGVPFRILDCQADLPLLRKRIGDRQRENKDPSEADLEILKYQLQHHDPLLAEEKSSTIVIDTRREFDPRQVLTQLP